MEAVGYSQFFLEWTAARKGKQSVSLISPSTFVPVQMSVWNLIVLGSWPSSWPQGTMLPCGLEYFHLFVSSHEAGIESRSESQHFRNITDTRGKEILVLLVTSSRAPWALSYQLPIV